jgi:hypothetical protein
MKNVYIVELYFNGNNTATRAFASQNDAEACMDRHENNATNDADSFHGYVGYEGCDIMQIPLE